MKEEDEDKDNSAIVTTVVVVIGVIAVLAVVVGIALLTRSKKKQEKKVVPAVVAEQEASKPKHSRTPTEVTLNTMMGETQMELSQREIDGPGADEKEKEVGIKIGKEEDEQI